MFNKLRLRLTLTSVAIVGLILLAIFSGIYFMMSRGLVQQSEHFLRQTITEVDSGVAVPNPYTDRQRRRQNFFYVKVTDSDQLIHISSDPPVTPEQIEELTHRAIIASRSKGILRLNGDEVYRYLKGSRSADGLTALAFINIRFEEDFLTRLLMALIITGLSGLALVFFGSLYTATRALQPIRESWERQKNFIADASHELRTPLAVIQTNLELVLGNSEENVLSQDKWLQNIRAENNRMTRLVSDLLLLARADSLQERMEFKLFPLHQAVMNACYPLEPLARKEGLKMDIRIEAEMELYGDEARIKQVIVILLDNAIKYNRSNGVVVLTLRETPGYAEIAVSDSGVGIEREHMDKIFQRFYRVDKARSREHGGSGLGLAIAEWIVRQHRGTIKVTSTTGEGTVFKVSLPKGN